MNTLCTHHIFFIHSSIDGHLGRFCILTVVNDATGNTGFPFLHILTHTCYFLITRNYYYKGDEFTELQRRWGHPAMSSPPLPTPSVCREHRPVTGVPWPLWLLTRDGRGPPRPRPHTQRQLPLCPGLACRPSAGG